MSELQQNRYDRLVRRVGGMIGPGSKVNEVLAEVFPSIDVEPSRGELMLLGDQAICMGGGVITGAVGEAPRASLFNPDGSNVLITITGVEVSVVATATIRYGRRDSALAATISTQIFRDYRLAAGAGPVGLISQLSSVAFASATGQFRVASNVRIMLEPENSIAVLPPNTGFEIGSAAVTGTLHYTFFWRERVAEESELNF